MPTKINIHVSGHALCFLKNNVWNLIMTSDSDHKVTISGRGLGQDLGTTNRRLDFDFDGSDIVQRTSSMTTGVGRLLNLSWPDMHGSSKGKSNLVEIRKDTIMHDYVWLKAPSSTLRVSEVTDSDYWIHEIMRDGTLGPKIRKEPLAKTVTLSFEVKTKLRFLVSDSNGKILDHPVPVDPTIPQLDFDICNDCKYASPHNDFGDVYEFVSDIPSGGKRQFVAGKEPQLFNGVMIKSHSELDPSSYRGLNGNCDPIGSDPPPQP